MGFPACRSAAIGTLKEDLLKEDLLRVDSHLITLIESVLRNASLVASPWLVEAQGKSEENPLTGNIWQKMSYQSCFQ